MTDKNKAHLFFSLFVNRSDVYAEQMPDGHYKKISEPLTEEVLNRHLKGEITIGTYQINASDNTAKWLCFDVDGHKVENPDEVVREIFRAATSGINRESVLVEASGSRKSHHIWIFFLTAIPVEVARFLGQRILRLCEVKDVELFPKQERVSEDRFGNLVKLPLGFNRKAKRWSTFLDPHTLVPIDSTCLNQVVPAILLENEIQRIWKEIEKRKKSKKIEKKFKPKLYRGVNPICIRKMLDGVKYGKRDEVAIRLARFFHTERGLSGDKTLKILLEWNERNDPPIGEMKDPLDPLDVIRYFLEKIESAGKTSHSFGCESLRKVSGICSGRDQCEFFNFSKSKRRGKKWSITICR